MQHTMQQAMQLTEVHEDPMDKLVHWLFAFVSYVMPVIVAVFAGWWIGDGYAGTGKQTAGDVYGVHVIAMAGELILPIITVACARAAKKAASDSGMYKWLAIGALLLVVVSTGSASAQWFLILNNIHASGYDPSSFGVMTMMLFRVCMPVAVDLGALLYLSIHGHRSLKRQLAQMDERAEAVEKLSERNRRIQAAEDRARREREDDEAQRLTRQRREEVLTRIEEMNAQAAISHMEQMLLKPPRIVDGDDPDGNRRNYRRS